MTTGDNTEDGMVIAVAALAIIAESYAWIPFEEGETIGALSEGPLDVDCSSWIARQPTNRRTARAALHRLGVPL